MKKPLLAFLTVLLFGHDSSAQTVRMGIKAGGVLSTLVGPGTSIEPAISPLVGIVAGAYRTLPLGSEASSWSLQSELLYNQQGYRLSHAPTNYEAIIRFHYVCLPVLLVFTHQRFFGEFGPQVGYLAGVRERYSFQSPNISGPTVHINTDPSGRSRWDAAFIAGIGYRWSKGIGVEVRYTGSLNSIYPDKGGAQSAKPRNASIQLQASYPLLKY